MISFCFCHCMSPIYSTRFTPVLLMPNLGRLLTAALQGINFVNRSTGWVNKTFLFSRQFDFDKLS
jgi:hypothetical protein